MRKSIIAVVVLSTLSASAFASSDYVGSGNYAADKKAQSTRDAGQDAAIHEVHMNMLTKYSESWGLEDRANIAKLQDSKVDKSVFEADQARQDKVVAGNYAELQGEVNTRQAADNALAREIKTKVSQSDFENDQQRQDKHINAVQDAAQSANEKADAGAVRADGIEKQAGIIDNRVGKTEVRLDNVEGGVRQTNAQLDADRSAAQVRIEQEQSTRATNDRLLADRVRTEETARSNADAGLSKRIDTKVDNSTFQQRSAVVDSRFADTQQRIDNNKAEQAKVNKAVASTLTNHEGRINSLESSTNSRFSNMDKRIDENKRNADAGISGVAAMANIPQVTEYQTFAVGAGVGTREGESALAVGFSARASQNTVIKASVAADSQQAWTVGAGVSYGW